MSVFARRDGTLHAESIALPAIAAQFGTPCFIYSRAALEASYRAFDAALEGRDHLICYAMKANSNLAILDVFARLGSGFDIVSGGELARALAAGADPRKIVFSGIGKTKREIRVALAAGILCFNVESAAELARVTRVAQDIGTRAPVSLRVNPDVDPKTHPYISTGLKENKFGVAYADALDLYRAAAASPHLDVAGLDFHIGSQLTEVGPLVDALDRALELVEALEREGIRLRHLDIGGGLGIRYRHEQPPAVADYLQAMLERLRHHPHRILLEPGRALVGNAGLLITRVEYLKPGAHRNFAVVDAAMNDLMRPALYDAWHDILPVVHRNNRAETYDVVGPVCESGDFIGRSRELAIAEGDLLAVMSAGAYGMSMSSNYNTRPRAAEVIVDGSTLHLVRERESLESLYAGERLLPR